MKKVIFLISGVTYALAYFAEDIVELPDNAKTSELIAKKVVATVKQPFTKLPASFPFREEIIKAGFYSLEELQKADKDDIINVRNSKKSIGNLYAEYKKDQFFNSL